ncbi:hypothetical protein [Archangium lipolyticum]|uniref:hypothetical protein n=1 Tax=Archangium lipolyticum TaxID=2970465 RepID=UPI00214A529E|nr:hypothetical protein [Archangium lipolyticum]
MRWGLVLGIALLVGSLGTGCPEQIYGREGYLDDAMREDIEEQHDERQRELGKPVPCRDGKRLVQICDPSTGKVCHWECQ